MALGAIIAAIKGAATAAKAANKLSGGSSSSSSSGSSSKTSGSSSGSSSSGSASSGSGSSGSSGSYVPKGTYNDAMIRDNSADQTAQLQKYKDAYAAAQAKGDKAGMQEAHKQAEALRSQWGYSGGSDGSDYIGNGYISGSNIGTMMGNQLNQGYEDYKNQMQQAADAQQSALKAKIDSAVANLEGQKYDISKQTEANNAAAEKAYMQSIKPGGSLAESLAANGLLTSGLTESSQISAGNTYQNALNNNATTQTEALAKIEQAITQARLTGDIEAANALADLYKEVAAKGYENAQNIVSAAQWGNQFGLSQAEQTGTYNGQATLAARQLELQRQQVEQDLEAGKIDMETARKQMEYIQAQIENMQSQTTGQNLENRYKQSQLSQLGF